MPGRPVSAGLDGQPAFVSSASYLPFGPATRLEYGNGAVKSMQYDTRYRLTQNTVTAGSTTAANYQYGYDPAGNVTEISDLLDSTYDRDFGYDDLNRLSVANSGSSLWGTGGMTYDGMGNMLDANVVPYISPPWRRTDEWKCFPECVLMHEQSHANDANRVNPGICRGERAYRMVVPTIFPNLNEPDETEERAWKVYLRCLGQYVRPGQSCKCQDVLKREMDRARRILRNRAW